MLVVLHKNIRLSSSSFQINQIDMINKAGKLSPHALIEFDLMIKGDKDVSFFYGEIENNSTVDKRFFHLKPEYGIEKLDKKSEFPIHIFYRKEKKYKALFLFNILEAALFNKDQIFLKELEIITGSLLGYSKEDIELYLEKNGLN